MLPYHINEAELDLPDEWSDKSVNIFSSGASAKAPLTLVISRDEMKEGQELADFADEKLAELSPQLSQFKLIDKRQVEVAGDVALDAEFTWRSNQGLMHQRQTYVCLGRRVLVFTATAPRELREQHRREVDAVLASLKFRS